MALELTSDDVLGQILSLLNGDDVFRLLTTGSPRFASRVARKMTHFELRASRNLFFPFGLWTLPNLESVVLTSSLNDDPIHFCTNLRPILPQEPSKGVLKFVFHAQLSSSLLALHPAHPTLSTALPNLLHLTLSGFRGQIPPNFAEGLPAQLKTLFISPAPENSNSTLPSSLFDALPSTLSEIRLFGVEIAEGSPNFNKLPLLTHLTVRGFAKPDILSRLPPQLQILDITVKDVEGRAVLASQIPHQIRVFKVAGRSLKLDIDAPLPETLELLQVLLTWSVEEATERLADFLSPSSLLSASPLDIIPYSEKLHAQFTSLERLIANWRSDKTEIGPNTFSTSLRHLTFNAPYSYALPYHHLPRGLIQLRACLNNPEQARTLPQTLTKLHIDFMGFNPIYAPPITDITPLPPTLTYLKADSAHFSSVTNIHALPKLKTFDLTISTPGFLPKLTFRGRLIESLEVLYVEEYTFEEADVRGAAADFFPPLGKFKRLHSLAFTSSNVTPLHENSLASLPPTLTWLSMRNVEFQSAAKCLASLPASLATLRLSKPINTRFLYQDNLFAHLPHSLTRLEVVGSAPSLLTQNLFSLLPKRISHIKIVASSSTTLDTTAYYQSNSFWN